MLAGASMILGALSVYFVREDVEQEDSLEDAKLAS
jgi:hypothetical protein